MGSQGGEPFEYKQAESIAQMRQPCEAVGSRV